VTTSQVEEEGFATITIADTGIGLDTDELEHCFDPFYRGQRVGQLNIPGTGLGLTLAKNIAEMHGGRITAASEVDVGSTFTVWLPLVQETAESI
jgi:signal transduction histidine kinase